MTVLEMAIALRSACHSVILDSEASPNAAASVSADFIRNITIDGDTLSFNPEVTP